MREFRQVLRDAGARVWVSAFAGLVAGLLEAAVLVLAIAAAVAMSRGTAPKLELPLHLSLTRPGVLVAVGLVCALLRTVVSLAGLRLATNAKSTMEAHYQRDLLGAYLAAPWEAVAGWPEGELQELASGQASVAASSGLHAAQALQAGLSFAALVASSLVVSPVTAIASIGGAVVLAVALRPIAAASSKRASRRMRNELDVAALTAESVRLAEEIAVFGVGPVQAERGSRVIEQKRKTGAAADFAVELTLTTYQCAVFVLVFIGLGVLVVADIAVGPALAAIILLLLRAFAYSQQAQSAYSKALTAFPRREALLDATKALADSVRPSEGRPLREIESCVLTGVSYTYARGQRALTGIDLTLRRGDALGVTGPSGSGKSTLVQLLLRLRTPSEGTYLVNEQPADEYAAEGWTAAVSLVPQEPKLIEGTIADNIRFLRARITDEQIARASMLAGLESDLAGFPEGLDRLVGPRDRALSGGQRQRLAIARALAGEPSLLVLDEPTSALDAECERIIQETLVSLKGTVTVVVITHRLTTLEQCDQVLVLRNGRIESSGAPGAAIETRAR